MAPGLLFAMLVIFCFTFFIINRIAFLDPFGFGNWHFVLTTFLTLNFFCLNYMRHWHRMTDLRFVKERMNFILFISSFAQRKFNPINSNRMRPHSVWSYKEQWWILSTGCSLNFLVFWVFKFLSYWQYDTDRSNENGTLTNKPYWNEGTLNGDKIH